MNVLKYSIVNALAISALYTVFINSIYVVFWRKMAKTSPNVMTKFYLAASALRLVSAAFVVTAYCLICHDKNSIRDFALLFMSFYIVMLVFDSVFFAHVEKVILLRLTDETDQTNTMLVHASIHNSTYKCVRAYR